MWEKKKRCERSAEGALWQGFLPGTDSLQREELEAICCLVLLRSFGAIIDALVFAWWAEEMPSSAHKSTSPAIWSVD